MLFELERKKILTDMVVHISNVSIWKAVTGEILDNLSIETIKFQTSQDFSVRLVSKNKQKNLNQSILKATLTALKPVPEPFRTMQWICLPYPSPN